MKKQSKKQPASFRNRARRKLRVSFKVHGTATRPRLAVFRSNKAFYAQVINDDLGTTLVSLATNAKQFSKKLPNSVEGTKQLGEELARQSLALKVSKVVFDRAGYLYHGKVRSFAEGARAGGLAF